MTSKPTTTSTHTSHVSLPLLVAQFDRHPMFTVSQPKLFPHIPLISPTPPPPPRPHALARAGILQHVYFALLDFPHNISDLVWGTQSAQSNYYTSKPTGPVDHILHIRLSFSSTFWPWYHPPLLGPHRSCLTPSSFWTRAIKKSTFYVSTKH